MARPLAVPDAGPLKRANWKLTQRTIEHVTRRAAENGQSPGQYLDQMFGRMGGWR